MILTIRLVLHIKWAVLLKSITLILLFVCCTQPCLFGEFESSSGFVIDEPLTNSLFATYSILLNFMWCNVRLFLPEWKCNSVSLYFVICQCCAYAMATKTFFLYIWQPVLHLIIPVYIYVCRIICRWLRFDEILTSFKTCCDFIFLRVLKH